MKNLKESVSAIFRSKSSGKIFVIQRQNYLTVFPGYTAFPGGKVDKADIEKAKNTSAPFEMEPCHWVALDREMAEELNFSLIENQNLLKDIQLFGTAITPEFNPYRFRAHFFVIEVEEEIDFNVDDGEAVKASWFLPDELLDRYMKNKLMAVPPVIKMFECMKNKTLDLPVNLGLPHIEGREVPMIESLFGIKQFLPLSNTFPPAKRTNCFIIGDEPLRLLVDPSPKDQEEKEKLIRSLDKIGFDAFFVSHHHPDHHEFLPDLVEHYKRPVYMSGVTQRFIHDKWGPDYLTGMEIIIVKEGDTIGTSLGRELKIYEVPGHDEGQLALAPEDMSWFFAGDLIQTVGTVVVGGYEGDMAKYFSSLEKVIDLAPKFVIPSHGIALGGTNKLEMTLKHRRHREETIIEMLKKGFSEEEILEHIYEGLDDRLIKYAKKTITAHIKKINDEGLV